MAARAEVGVSAVAVTPEKSTEFDGVRTAVSEYAATPAGIHSHCAVIGEDPDVATFSQPGILVPLVLKAMDPGTDAVAVIVSTAPYVGVAFAKASDKLVVAFETVRLAVAEVLNE